MSNRTVFFSTLMLSVAIFVWDCSIELGVAGGVPYVASVLLSIRMSDRRFVLVVAAACSVLTLLGFFFSPPGGELWKVVMNRTLAILAIWVAAILSLRWRIVQDRVLELEKTIERQQGEEVFRLAMEAAPSGMLLADKNGQIVLLNTQIERMFGYDRQELLGQAVELLAPQGVREKHATLRAGYMQEPHFRPMGASLDLVGQAKDGHVIPIDIGLNPISNSSGQFILASIVDITVLKSVARLRGTDVQLRIAHAIQERFFPISAPQLPGFDIAGAVHPAAETSGDYYDFIPMLDGTLGIVIADVSGHGFGPALLMANTRAYLRTLAHTLNSVCDILTTANRMLLLDTDGRGFVTIFLAVLNPALRTFTYAAAGHKAYHFTADDRVVELDAEHPPLGIIEDIEFHRSPPVSLQEGELLLLMTDGIQETASSDETLFGIERTLAVVRQHRTQSAQAIIDALYRESRAFAGNAKQGDDITAVVVKA